jgi:hypothetical protein
MQLVLPFTKVSHHSQVHYIDIQFDLNERLHENRVNMRRNTRTCF